MLRFKLRNLSENLLVEHFVGFHVNEQDIRCEWWKIRFIAQYFIKLRV